MAKVPRTFFSSDFHLWHRLVSRLRGFGEDLDAHNQEISDGWDDNVKDEDTVWIIGDLTMRDVEKSLEWISARPGTKHFVSGNHDPCHPMHRQWAKHVKRFEEVFETVQPLASVRMEGHTVLLSHFPMGSSKEGADHTVEPRYLEWRVRDSGMWLLHGHTHAADQRLHDGNQIHIGWDAWRRLVPIEEIQKLIRES